MCVLGWFCRRCGLLSSVWGISGRWLLCRDSLVGFGCGVWVMVIWGVMLSTVLVRVWWFVEWVQVFLVLVWGGWLGGLNDDWVDVGLAAVWVVWL